jgi:hypothetical protein
MGANAAKGDGCSESDFRCPRCARRQPQISPRACFFPDSSGASRKSNVDAIESLGASDEPPLSIRRVGPMREHVERIRHTLCGIRFFLKIRADGSLRCVESVREHPLVSPIASERCIERSAGNRRFAAQQRARSTRSAAEMFVEPG